MKIPTHLQRQLDKRIQEKRERDMMDAIGLPPPPGLGPQVTTNADFAQAPALTLDAINKMMAQHRAAPGAPVFLSSEDYPDPALTFMAWNQPWVLAHPRFWAAMPVLPKKSSLVGIGPEIAEPAFSVKIHDADAKGSDWKRRAAEAMSRAFEEAEMRKTVPAPAAPR